jgi:hypothetical protein
MERELSAQCKVGECSVLACAPRVLGLRANAECTGLRGLATSLTFLGAKSPTTSSSSPTRPPCIRRGAEVNRAGLVCPHLCGGQGFAWWSWRLRCTKGEYSAR